MPHLSGVTLCHLAGTHPYASVAFYHIPYYYTGYTQKNGAVSTVNKKLISHLTPSAAATVQFSHALPAVRF
jgi:hypothetical protein